MLRINRPGGAHAGDHRLRDGLACVLRRDADLAVPEPVAARDGALTVVAHDSAVPEPHVCVLLRWLDGRFVDRGLTPAHLAPSGRPDGAAARARGALVATFGVSSTTVDTLTDGGKVESMARSAADARRRVHPTRQDSDPGVRRGGRHLKPADAALFAEALEVVLATMGSRRRPEPSA